MEPGDRPAQEVADTQDAAARTTLRTIAGCALLIGIAFIQSPGQMIADTKFDLVVAPAKFLARALHLWDPQGTFGQLQNQAYGYLWPMGPFHILGAGLDLPGWVTQRLWLALVMCVAFVGAVRLARAMGIRRDIASLVVGFAYATSPRMVSIVGSISIEAWPSALAPWVLLPLVISSTRGSPRRMAMFSGLAVAMVGGVNAAATLAVLPLGVLWLLTRTPGPRRRSMMLWWPVFTFLGTCWWLVPLFVMGAYSPPFLDFIETASVTTFPTTLFDALRGTSAWVPYVDPSWQGGYALITTPYAALNSGLLLLLGLVGLMQRANPHRLFLLLSVFLGLLMVTAGHLGSVQGWGAGALNELLDGALAPLRNVHKFDPVIRLPMVLGLGWLVESAWRSRASTSFELPGRSLRIPTHGVLAGLMILGVVGAAIPVISGRLAPTSPVSGTPDYWQRTVDWLDENSGDSVTLLAPGSGFAEYVWGSPRDEPMQYLSASRWAVRNAVPLTPPGNIRMLDAFEARMAQGRGSSGLATFLGRAGVGHVVVRNDLTPGNDVPDRSLVRQALGDSPGLKLVRSFGPDVGGEAYVVNDEDQRLVVNGGWQEDFAAIEVYEVTSASTDAVGAEKLPVVVGGPEDLLDLTDADLLRDEPTQLAADVGPRSRPDGPLILTDGMLERERFFGRVHDGASSVFTKGDVRRSGNPTMDYALPGGSRWKTRSRLDGAKRISASSSMSDTNNQGGVQPGHLTYAAIDGLDDTEWVSGFGASSSAWWQVDLDEPTSVDEVGITLGGSVDSQKRIRVVTDTGTSDVVELGAGERKVVPIEAEGPASWVRVEDAAAEPGQLALSEVHIDGVQVRRPLVLPNIPGEWGSPDAIQLRTLDESRTGCAEVEGAIRCMADRARAAEEPRGLDRRFTLPAAATYSPTLVARPRAGAALEALVQRGQPLNATGSSTAVADPRASGVAAVDGDAGTTWTPEKDDFEPQLSLNWLGKRKIDGVSIKVDPNAPARRPTAVTLVWPGGERDVELDERGRARFRAIRTDQLRVRITGAGDAVSINPAGIGSPLPVGISEIRLKGLPLAPLALSRRERALPCGSGPTVTVNGEVRRTQIIASAVDLYAMKPTEVTWCDRSDIDLPAGESAVTAERSDFAIPQRLDLVGSASSHEVLPAHTTTNEGPVSRTIQPRAGSAYLALRQNVNPGWVATQGDQELEPVVIDGWRQGWSTDGSAEPVSVRFAPDRAYQWGLGVGLLLFVVLIGCALLSPRRWPGEALPALRARRIPDTLLLLTGAALGGLFGGWLGALAAVGGMTLGAAALRWLGGGREWLVASPLFVAALGYFIRPWGNSSGWAGAWAWPHYLVLVALSAALVVAAEPRLRFLSRMKGSSTKR